MTRSVVSPPMTRAVLQPFSARKRTSLRMPEFGISADLAPVRKYDGFLRVLRPGEWGGIGLFPVLPERGQHPVQHREGAGIQYGGTGGVRHDLAGFVAEGVAPRERVKDAGSDVEAQDRQGGHGYPAPSYARPGLTVLLARRHRTDAQEGASEQDRHCEVLEGRPAHLNLTRGSTTE
jgi:hypothetical protein